MASLVAESSGRRRTLKRWVVDLTTCVHLWCAEHELRMVEPSGLSTVARRARQENLDRLRAYRVSRQFPRNHSRTRTFEPVFVDDEGRHCAVAYLMTCTGDQATARRIARTHNRARIRQMDQEMLAIWANGTGLSPKELARIQPNYPPEPLVTPEAAWFPYAERSLPILMVLGSGLTVLNLLRLVAGSFRTVMAQLGIGLSIVALAVGLLVQDTGHAVRQDPGIMLPGDIDIDPYEDTIRQGETTVVVGVLVGVANLSMCLTNPLLRRRHRSRQTAEPGQQHT